MGKGDIENPDLTYSRTVGSFYLDRFEVTVDRFEQFMAAYSIPAEGAGQHPNIPGSGWRNAWKTVVDVDHPPETAVPPTNQELLTQLTEAGHCSASTYAAGDPGLPVNCVNWYVAFAFCIYDGGRLPTESEWNYAAAHGADARPYPWSQSVSDTAVDATRATYFVFNEPLLTLPTAVGSHPAGRGGFFRNSGQGHDDLAGNVIEWTADQWSPAPSASCNADCMVPWDAPTDERVLRGGSFQTDEVLMRTGSRTSSHGFNLLHLFGFRCARDANTNASGKENDQ